MSRLITEEAVYEYLVSKFDEFDISIFGNEFAGKILDGLGDIPTIDEKEIIRKPMERIVERLEKERHPEIRGGWETMRIDKAIEICKEEGGIE